MNKAESTGNYINDDFNNYIKYLLVGLTADQSEQKKRLVNLEIGQQKSIQTEAQEKMNRK